MPDQSAAFVGSIPANYHRYLGPLFFHGYAEDLAARVPPTPAMRVLEIACGTGIVTRRLVERIGPGGRVVATDLNQAMIDQARTHVPSDAPVEWQTADATRLPFPDRSFGAVVCQFGLMFFPDKAAAIRETLRVLEPGGLYLFSVWDSLEHNHVARITHETVAAFFPDDPPKFYTVPMSLHDPAPIRAWLSAAGFEGVAHETVSQTTTSPSAAEATVGLIEGNPIVGEIMARRPAALAEIEAAVARSLAERLGDCPMPSPLRALIFSARRPAR